MVIERVLKSWRDLIKPFIQLGLRIVFSFQHDTGAFLRVCNVFERIGVEQDEIGAFVFLDRSGLIERPKELRRISRGNPPLFVHRRRKSLSRSCP